MPYSIHNHLRYNAWANARIAELVAPLDSAVIFRERKSSFPSIAKTLLHIHDAEIIWTKRLQGESLTSFPSRDFLEQKEMLLRDFVLPSQFLVEFIASRGPEFLGSKFSYLNLKGDPFTDVVENALFHVVNHGTYHRGQITTLLREAGLTQLVSTDLIHYVRTLT